MARKCFQNYHPCVRVWFCSVCIQDPRDSAKPENHIKERYDYGIANSCKSAQIDSFSSILVPNQWHDCYLVNPRHFSNDWADEGPFPKADRTFVRDRYQRIVS